MWPIVPTFTCGLVRSNFFLATVTCLSTTCCGPAARGAASPLIVSSGDRLRSGGGAHNRVRTDDLFLTKEVLCRLSYVGPEAAQLDPTTGLEPGTGGLQNRCSTN